MLLPCLHAAALAVNIPPVFTGRRPSFVHPSAQPLDESCAWPLAHQPVESVSKEREVVLGGGLITDDGVHALDLQPTHNNNSGQH